MSTTDGATTRQLSLFDPPKKLVPKINTSSARRRPPKSDRSIFSFIAPTEEEWAAHLAEQGELPS